MIAYDDLPLYNGNVVFLSFPLFFSPRGDVRVSYPSQLYHLQHINRRHHHDNLCHSDGWRDQTTDSFFLLDSGENKYFTPTWICKFTYLDITTVSIFYCRYIK